MNIRENVGILDSAIRSVLSVVLFVLVTESLVTGNLAIFATIVGTIMLITASIGNCPLYKLLGINTWGNKKHFLIEH